MNTQNFSVSFGTKLNFGQPIFSVEAQTKLDELRQKETEATQALEQSRTQTLENFRNEIKSLPARLGLRDLDEVKNVISLVQENGSLDQYSQNFGFIIPEVKTNHSPAKVANNPFKMNYLGVRGKKTPTIIRQKVKELLVSEKYTGTEISKLAGISLASVNNMKRQFELSNRRS